MTDIGDYERTSLHSGDGSQLVRCLSIGSSDSSGGAGIQGDIKTFASLGCYGMTAVVGVTAQNTLGVISKCTIPSRLVAAQIEGVVADIGVDAIKIGTTWSQSVMTTIADSIGRMSVPIVFDPVLVSAARSMLANPDEVIDSACSVLLPLATVVTPNVREARFLTGCPELRGSALAEAVGAVGAKAVIVTGGAVGVRGDAFFDGEDYCEIEVEWDDRGAVHGSGCAHSAALAAFLGLGVPLYDAALLAARVASAGVSRGAVFPLGQGPQPVDVLDLRSAARSAALRLEFPGINLWSAPSVDSKSPYD